MPRLLRRRPKKSQVGPGNGSAGAATADFQGSVRHSVWITKVTELHRSSRQRSSFILVCQQHLRKAVLKADFRTSHRTISWNATGTLIATGSTDKVIRLWNPEITTSKSQIELRGHTQPIEKLLFNPTREFELASCASDGTVRFWDTRSKACTTKLEVAGEVFTLSWSVDGTVLVAGTKVSLTVNVARILSSDKTQLPERCLVPHLNHLYACDPWPPPSNDADEPDLLLECLSARRSSSDP